ncbi:hypothetical protein [Micromonospora craniellae]|uniref:hypothetical protein n=1 Tax=Micromonospora craniellae TaxID=2294034 RepID=UPI000E3BC8AD|nr:hypothetical protein [Micromonospora craniellae]QOC91129.1 hypothetical protein ID554_24280 [Micromonospora craniellae]
MQQHCCAHPRETPLASAEDVADADDILIAHAPRAVSRLRCGCGDDYPCAEVRFATLVKAATVRASR